jgi:tRNA(fMet)-specific endonuclease VapC
MADGHTSLKRILASARVLPVPVIVPGEYAFGIRLSRHRSRYEKWLEELLDDCRVLQVDQSTAEAYADIRGELKTAGRPIPSNDLWIAALARQYALPLVSRDLHFDFVKRLRRVTW